MYNDLSTTESRFSKKPVQKVNWREYAVALGYAAVALPFVYSFVVIYSLLLK
jgi:hypothetical protein